MTAAAPVSSAFAAARRELRYLRETPAELLLMTLFPCVLGGILAWLLSAAAIRDLPVTVVDQDRSSLSRDLIRRLDNSPGLRVASVLGDMGEAWSRVRGMDAYAVVLIPDLSTRRLYREGSARLLVYYNASYLTAGQGAARDVAAAVASLNAQLLLRDIAKMRGTAGLRSPPLGVQATLLSNAPRSFEHYLLELLFPGVLHLMAGLGMVASLGREVRDGTRGPWLAASPHPLASLAGKLAPYVLWFGALSCVGFAYLVVVCGSVIAGSAGLLVAGAFALALAGAGISLLLVGALRDMGTALSMCGLYIGTALAFSGATFPTLGGALFTRIWNLLLPLTAYLKLQLQQFDVGSPVRDSLLWLGVLLLFCLLPGAIGAYLLLRHARQPAAA
ncbi:ABC transporter permease [Tahibacter harae]|uniref:ABC transporter permease n=1 Tax=Tahibacter harae TaxID=2963937 RepID=A0ABT1QLT6_9GAMM|nr:ABC transporter permease [Tahibacter harae]MCQ4163422.1 ABC transporter permease [Tahibacter harae]